MPTAFNTIPGIRQLTQVNPRNPFTSIHAMNRAVPLAGIIDGTKSRDADNSSVNVLRAGLLMGKVTTGGKYAAAVIGLTAANYTSGGTSLTLTTVAAVELVRRIGASGTFTLNGPPSAGGTNATVTVTYSAVNTGTGVVTVTNIGANVVAGSLVGDTDGSQNPIAILAGPGTEYGIDVTDLNSASQDMEMPQFYVSGDYYSAMVINLSTGTGQTPDASVEKFIKTQLRANGGIFTFDDDR